MARKTATLLLMALACGGRGHDAEREPLQPSTADAGVASTSSGPTVYTGGEAAEICLGVVGDDPSALRCATCVPGVVPRCIDRPIPERDSEPPACAAPDCEVPVGRNLTGQLSGAIAFRGSCADGKSFDAMLGPLGGVVHYYRDGAGLVGTTMYSPNILKCECSGEAFVGDVSCMSPAFETEPSGEVRLPFADGRPSAPCMCKD